MMRQCLALHSHSAELHSKCLVVNLMAIYRTECCLQASCPPSSWYTSADGAALELQRVFRNTWQVRGTSGDVFRFPP